MKNRITTYRTNRLQLSRLPIDSTLLAGELRVEETDA